MQCQHCGKSDWVTIGDQKYCASCGEPGASAINSPVNSSNNAPAPLQASPAATPPNPALPEIKPESAPIPVATSSNTTLKPTSLNDLSHPQSPAPASTPTPVAVKPANTFHSGPAPAGVIDLRQITPTPVVPSPPEPTKMMSEAVTPPAQDISPITADPSVQSVATSVVNPPPITPTSPAPSSSQPASIQKFVRPNPAPPESPQAPAPAPALPNHVATQMESLNRLVPTAAIPATNPQLPNTTPTPPSNSTSKTQGVMAATAAIVLMGGYIWLNNFNTLSVKSASKKAGIEASLPAYMPNSYSMAGPVAYGQGFISLNFKSPNSATPLVITQRRTNWDSAALLQLYVHPKSNSYVSVASQGLTIYLYDNNQATWINKGLQYVISGDTRLSREQILKIAQSL